MDLLTIFGIATICLVLLMFPVLYRLIKGPTMIDRILSANIIGTKAVSLLILVGLLLGKLDMYVDLAITYALLNFLASLVAGRFMKHSMKR